MEHPRTSLRMRFTDTMIRGGAGDVPHSESLAAGPRRLRAGVWAI